MAVKIKTNLIHLDAERIKRRGDKPMIGPELLDEFEFLLDAGTHPLLAVELLGADYANLQRLASRYGRVGLFARVDIGAWKRDQLPERSGWGFAA
jgi:hypothetical protein